MNLTKISSGLREALTERGHDELEIERMDADKAFDEYCNWHGLIEWGPQLRSIYENAKKANQ